MKRLVWFILVLFVVAMVLPAMGQVAAKQGTAMESKDSGGKDGGGKDGGGKKITELAGKDDGGKCCKAEDVAAYRTQMQQAMKNPATRGQAQANLSNYLKANQSKLSKQQQADLQNVMNQR